MIPNKGKSRSLTYLMGCQSFCDSQCETRAIPIPSAVPPISPPTTLYNRPSRADFVGTIAFE